MKPDLNNGQLVRWDDDRGFGFIMPREGGKEVFLHIAVIKTVGRRPRVGDLVSYELVTGSDGRSRASSASIKGVAASKPLILPKVQATPSKWKLKGGQFVKSIISPIVVVTVIVTIALIDQESRPSRSPTIISSMLRPGCIIKGNISYNTGNRLYHIPGMENYDQTVINPQNGEKWFCSESAAVAAGWTKATR
jgi:cold shock CspA family protein